MSTGRTVIKNTSVLLSGRILTMGLGVVYVAALARYVQAAGMGKIATAISLVSILSLLMNFGLSQLIVRDVAGEKSRAGIYATNALLLRALLSIAFAIVVVVVAGMAEYPSDTTLIIYVYAFSYVFDTFTDVAFSIFNAFEKMGYPTAIQTGRDIINIVLSLVAIYLHASLIAIVCISALASLIKLVVGMAVLRVRLVRLRLQFDPLLCRELLVAALPFAALTVLQVINRQIDTVLLSLYRSADQVGWFSAANTLITYLLILPTMFLQAIFPVFSRFHAYSQGDLQQAYRTSFKYLMLLGFPLCVGTIVTADRVIALVYGPGFENAAVALRILALLLFWMFGFANGALLNATGGQAFSAAMAGIAAIVNVAAGLVLIPRWSFLGASIAATLPGAVFFLPITLMCHRRLGIRLPNALALKTLISSVCMGAAVALSLKAHGNLFVAILAAAPIVYGVSLVAFRAIGREELWKLARLFRSTDRGPLEEVAGRS